MEEINGKELSKKIRNELKEKIFLESKRYKRRPKLAVILVGDDVASKSYVKGKEKACLEIGIENQTILLDENTSEDKLIEQVETLNNDDTVDGILIQLPLPKRMDEKKVLSCVRLDKDVDGFHPLNVAGLYMKQTCVIPCTPKGILQMLDDKKIQIEGKHAVVVGRSQIVGLPVAKLLLDRNATVTIVHSKTINQKEICRTADILVVAMGKPKYITEEYVKKGAVIIDVGVNRDQKTNKLCGDCDFDSVSTKASYCSIVPGGVGPMTITCLMENTYDLYIKHQKE